MRQEDVARERYYRLTRATMTLLAGDDQTRGDPNVMVVAGPEMHRMEQYRALLETVVAQEKTCIYVEAPPAWAATSQVRLHVIGWTGVATARFNVTGRCAFWAAADTGPVLITSRGGELGHFEMTPGRLVHRAGPPSGDLEGGLARARRRFRAEIENMRDVARGLERMPTRHVRDLDDLKRLRDR